MCKVMSLRQSGLPVPVVLFDNKYLILATQVGQGISPG